MDIDPIQEKTSSINKLIKWVQSLFKNKKDCNRIIKTTKKEIKDTCKAFKDYGTSCQSAAYAMQKMGTSIFKFNEILTPDQMREKIYKNTSILYADNKPYCKLNEKGEILWLNKNK